MHTYGPSTQRTSVYCVVEVGITRCGTIRRKHIAAEYAAVEDNFVYARTQLDWLVERGLIRQNVDIARKLDTAYAAAIN